MPISNLNLDETAKIIPTEIETDVLIVGTGPAGAGLACFLASNGVKGIMIGDSSGSITTPRAHIVNMAALECLRDIGLEDSCIRAATHREAMQHTRWCYSMAGDEFARIHSWGNDPFRAGDYFAASPCSHCDCPQTVLEPILIQHAVQHGFVCRFNTKFLTFSRQNDRSVEATVQDCVSNVQFKIRSKYLFGCDGARSNIVRQLELPLMKKPGQGLALNILVRADLSKLMSNRTGNLHWVMQPDREYPDFGWMAIVRMVKPWFEWVFILFPHPSIGTDVFPSNEECLSRVKELIGDDSIDVEILDVTGYYEAALIGFSHCLGDAVHRHPPFNGLGSNTCIQDAYNLAWKVAYVLNNSAGSKLLDTYSEERQPVGLAVITRANQGFREHSPIWKLLGMMEPELEKRKKIFKSLSEATAEGTKSRMDLQRAIEDTAHEFHGLGIEMNHRYKSSAIYLEDESDEPSWPKDPILEHQISTFPGSRLPHAWLNKRSPVKPISTIDLAGHGKFCLLTGIGGEAWASWANAVAQELEVPIVHHSIGWQQDYEDVYSDWQRRREVSESGCVLARPDRFIAWRCQSVGEGSYAKLLLVLKCILGRQNP